MRICLNKDPISKYPLVVGNRSLIYDLFVKYND